MAVLRDISPASEAPLARRADRLRNGPAVLFVGQAHLSEGGIDPFLARAIEHLEAPENRSYNALLGAPETDEFLRWLAGHSRSIVPPTAREIVCGYGWNAVFTSSIDTTLPNLLRNGWVGGWKGTRIATAVGERARSSRPPVRVHQEVRLRVLRACQPHRSDAAGSAMLRRTQRPPWLCGRRRGRLRRRSRAPLRRRRR